MPACSPEHSHWSWDCAFRPSVIRAASWGSGGGDTPQRRASSSSGPKFEGVGSATFDERNRLERFRRGSEVGHVVGITVGSEQSPGDVGDDDDAGVGALDELSPSDFR